MLIDAGFNPRPREGATKPTREYMGLEDCFNPRPREGATIHSGHGSKEGTVSIHAPVKGRQC